MTKTITIRDQIYKKLVLIKGENENFSELFERLTQETPPQETLKKIRGSIKFKDKEKMLQEISNLRDE